MIKGMFQVLILVWINLLVIGCDNNEVGAAGVSQSSSFKANVNANVNAFANSQKYINTSTAFIAANNTIYSCMVDESSGSLDKCIIGLKTGNPVLAPSSVAAFGDSLFVSGWAQNKLYRCKIINFRFVDKCKITGPIYKGALSSFAGVIQNIKIFSGKLYLTTTNSSSLGGLIYTCNMVGNNDSLDCNSKNAYNPVGIGAITSNSETYLYYIFNESGQQQNIFSCLTSATPCNQETGYGQIESGLQNGSADLTIYSNIAYILNGNLSINSCQVRNGFLINCTQAESNSSFNLSQVNGAAIVEQNNYLYFNTGNTIPGDSVGYCQILSDGSLGLCQTTANLPLNGNNFVDGSSSITFAHFAAIVYVTTDKADIDSCLIKKDDGGFECVNDFHYSKAIIPTHIASSGSFLYITYNLNDNKIKDPVEQLLICPENGISIKGCVTSNVKGTSGTDMFVTIDPIAKIAYITGYMRDGNNSLQANLNSCDLNESNGLPYNCNNTPIPKGIADTGTVYTALAFESSSTIPIGLFVATKTLLTYNLGECRFSSNLLSPACFYNLTTGVKDFRAMVGSGNNGYMINNNHTLTQFNFTPGEQTPLANIGVIGNRVHDLTFAGLSEVYAASDGGLFKCSIKSKTKNNCIKIPSNLDNITGITLDFIAVQYPSDVTYAYMTNGTANPLVCEVNNQNNLVSFCQNAFDSGKSPLLSTSYGIVTNGNKMGRYIYIVDSQAQTVEECLPDQGGILINCAKALPLGQYISADYITFAQSGNQQYAYLSSTYLNAVWQCSVNMVNGFFQACQLFNTPFSYNGPINAKLDLESGTVNSTLYIADGGENLGSPLIVYACGVPLVETNGVLNCQEKQISPSLSPGFMINHITGIVPFESSVFIGGTGSNGSINNACGFLNYSSINNITIGGVLFSLPDASDCQNLGNMTLSLLLPNPGLYSVVGNNIYFSNFDGSKNQISTIPSNLNNSNLLGITIYQQ